MPQALIFIVLTEICPFFNDRTVRQMAKRILRTVFVFFYFQFPALLHAKLRSRICRAFHRGIFLNRCTTSRQNRSGGNAQNNRFHHIISFRYFDSDDLSTNFATGDTSRRAVFTGHPSEIRQFLLKESSPRLNKQTQSAPSDYPPISCFRCSFRQRYHSCGLIFSSSVMFSEQAMMMKCSWLDIGRSMTAEEISRP